MQQVANIRYITRNLVIYSQENKTTEIAMGQTYRVDGRTNTTYNMCMEPPRRPIKHSRTMLVLSGYLMQYSM
jgi:hypothetical protein